MGQREQGPAEPQQGAETPIVGQVVLKTSRFSKDVLATMISLASAAFGVVAALAWNTAITELFDEVFGKDARISALFVYAVLITLVGVVVIVLMGRLAARLSAEPVEFKYPGVPKS
jgi:ABC-type Mn2+/Zn2+ transport system permease subunit